MRSLLARLRDTFRRRKLDRELDDEIATHLELAIAEFQARGMSPEDARRAALRIFGGVSQTKEAEREVRSFPLLETAWALARDAVRMLWRQPRFSAVAIFTLALGIGATTAIYSVVHGVLLKPLPFRDPDRLVALYHVTPASQKDLQGASHYFTYRDRGRVFEDIGLWQAASVAIVRAGLPEQVRVLRVTDGTLSLLDVHPHLGRLFEKTDDVSGAPLVAVLTHAYWQQAFDGSADVVGQSLVLNGEPCEIVGVLPASFKFLDTNPQLLLPMRFNRATTRTGSLGANGVARLKRGVTLDEANADIARMIPLVVEEFPLRPGITQEMWDAVGLAPNVRPLSEAVIGDVSRPLWILLGTVVLVLLMAWTNVANLLLVRADGRQHEFAVRAALGASRGRMAAAMLSESLVLGLSGAAVGVMFAKAGIDLLRWLAPVGLPRLSEIGIDTSVLLVTLAISVATGLIFGVIPVLRARVFSAEVLKESVRTITGSGERQRMRNTLVVGQIALAVVLLTVFGLMARTFATMRQVQPGFVRPAEVQTFDLSLPPTLIPDGAQVAPTFEQISERLRNVPGVAAVGLGAVTMNGRAGKAPIFVDGLPAPTLPSLRYFWPVGDGYFETIGNPIIAGRAITWSDIHQLKPLAIISENLALEYWDTPAKAIGHRIRSFPDDPWQEIVGVAGNVRADGLNHPPPALVYSPIATEQVVTRGLMYMVRSDRTGTPGFLQELRQAVWSVNPSVPLANVRTLADIHADSMASISFATIMLMIAAAVAMLLAVVGVYSVVSHVAAERTNEVGVRMALGAQPADVRRLFLRYGLTLTSAGIAVGLAGAAVLTPVMSALLYGVSPVDPVTYVAVSIALSGVTLLATLLPAHRASVIPPIIALRSRV